MKENNDSVYLKHTSVATVVILTVITCGIYCPIWYLNRCDAFNKLQSKEKLGKGIYIFGIIIFSIATLLNLYSGLSNEISQIQSGSDMALKLNYLDLLSTTIIFIALIPLIQQTFKIKHILLDHYNGYLKKNIEFSNALTLLLLNIYLQYKINKIERSNGRD